MMFALMCLCALTAPLGEGAFQLAALVLLVGACIDVVREKSLPWADVNQNSRWVVWLWFGWCAVGVASALLQGREPRFSHMSQLTMAWGGLLGYWVIGRLSARQAEILCLWFFGGAMLSAGLGVSQFLWGTFPGEDFLRGGRGYMGQLLIPGSEGERAAAGAFLNRLKLSEALLLALAAVGAWLSAGVGVRLTGLQPRIGNDLFEGGMARSARLCSGRVRIDSSTVGSTLGDRCSLCWLYRRAGCCCLCRCLTVKLG